MAGIVRRRHLALLPFPTLRVSEIHASKRTKRSGSSIAFESARVYSSQKLHCKLCFRCLEVGFSRLSELRERVGCSPSSPLYMYAIHNYSRSKKLSVHQPLYNNPVPQICGVSPPVINVPAVKERVQYWERKKGKKRVTIQPRWQTGFQPLLTNNLETCDRPGGRYNDQMIEQSSPLLWAGRQ